MHCRFTSWIKPLATVMASGAIAALLLATGGRAQGLDSTLTASTFVPPPAPSLQNLDQAILTQNFTAVQLRRFRDPQSVLASSTTTTATTNIVTVREHLQVVSNGTHQPSFTITFQGVEGELPGSAVTQQWQQVYSRYASQFYTHASFRIRNLASAVSNYTIHDFGPVVRANRSARRMLVFPGALDKALWVLDVDTQTNVPLYTAEFDVQLQLLAEVEVINFTPTAASVTAASSTLIPQASYSQAVATMGNPAELVNPLTSAAMEYVLEKVEVQNDPLNGQWRLLMTYTDGIDQFVIVESPDSTSGFSSLPGMSRSGHVIGRYRDPAMSVLLFWEGDVAFQVIGRGALRRLDDVAQSLYRQALATH